ncbi:major histocompatibility complex class I-related gene protein-like isoform X1 [Mobula birostris]|uniref:major histocompatibility complex class I-related gene protein-like isoform X1 n=2 Tax=Mobula birostris TaxID=1983395 RepID=UPI003B285DCC
MESWSGPVSLLVTALSLCSVAGQQAGSHSLIYYYFQSISIPEMPAFFRIGMLDDLQIDYYDNTLHEVEVKYQWIADGLSTDYWKEQKEITDQLHELLSTYLKPLTSLISFSYIQALWSCTQSGDTVNEILKINVPDIGEFSCDLNTLKCSGALFPAMLNDQLSQLRFTDMTASKSNCTWYLQRAVQLGKEALERQVAPKTQVLTRRPTATEGESLSCIITPFYPRAIKATWLKNGQVVSEGYKVTVLPNYNDTYWMELVIELQGNDPNIYACHVEHSSLPKAKGGVGEPHGAGPMLGLMTVFAIIFGVM